MHSNIPQFTISSDYQISRIIKGGWQLAGGHGVIERQTAIEDMFTFVDTGVTTFDCADIYTGVEELIGEFRRKYEKKFGKRELANLHVHTKFVPDRDMLPKITKGYVEKIIDRSLKRLGVERLDMVQFHWWDYEIPRFVETAGFLKSLQKKGKIRFVSTTNFDVDHLDKFVSSGVIVTTQQVQYSLLDQRPEKGMVEYCKKHGIKFLCYGTLAGGFLSERYLGAPEPKEPLENRSLTKYKLIIDDFGGWELFQKLLVVLDFIAKKHRVTIANVANRYVLEKPQVAAVIVGARNSQHLASMQDTFAFSLGIDDYNLLNKLLVKSQGPTGDVYFQERIKDGKHASIMKYNLNKK